MKQLVPLNKSCYYDYNIFNEDTGNYGFNWTSLNPTTTQPPSTTNPLSTQWNNNSNFTVNSTLDSTVNVTNATINYNLTTSYKYTKSNVLKNNPYLGTYTSYLGGGYVYLMNSDLISTISDLEFLQQTNWIDKNTRALFFELTLYNPNLNLFCSVIILFEVMPTGDIVSTVDLNVMNMWSSTRQIMLTVCMCIFAAIVIVMLAKEVKSCYRMRNAYFKQPWIYYDWILFILTLVSMPIYYYKILALQSLLSFVESNSFAYVNLSTLVAWNSALGYILAICSFLVTIRMIKLLKFNRKLSFLLKVIRNCMKDLISFFLVFFLIFLAYTQLMYLFYYENVPEYRSFVLALVTNFRMITGHFDFTSMINVNYAAGVIIFSTYNIIFVILMITFIITILTDNIRKTRKEFKMQADKFSLYDHIASKIKKNIQKSKLLKKVGKVNKEESEPKYIDQNEVDKYVDNMEAFEIATKKLVDTLKGRIQANNDFSKI